MDGDLTKRQESCCFLVFKLILFIFLISNSFFGQTFLTIKGKTINGKINYLTFSKLNFWYFLPNVFDSTIVKDDGFIKTLQVQNEPLFLYCGAKNLGLIFPDLAKKYDTLELVIDVGQSQFLVQNDVKVKYDYFYSYQTRYRVNGGFDSSFILNLSLESDVFAKVTKENFDQHQAEIESVK